MKKMIYIFLVFAVFFASLPVCFAEENEPDYAEIIFDRQIKMTNISHWSPAETANYKFEDRGGKTGVLRSPEGKNYFLCIGVDDKFLYSESGKSVAVTVEYYDEGSGTFTIRYDSAEHGKWASPPEIVTMTDAKEWKSYTFRLDDCLLRNGLMNHTDMEIGLWALDMGTSPGPIVIRSVRIEECFPGHPLSITAETGYAGNILGKNDNGVFDLKFKNITDTKLDADVKYRVRNSQNAVIAEGEGKVYTEPLGEGALNIDTKIEKYDLYEIDVEYTAETEVDGVLQTIEDKKALKISKALTTEPGEDKNDYVYLCTHLDRYDQKNSLEVISRMGFAGIREGMNWNTVEASKGVYKLNEQQNEKIETLSEDKLDMMLLLAYSNPLYITDRPYSITTAPYHDHEIEAFARYAGFMARELKGKIDKFEIWNEWNIKSFNAEQRGADVYARLLKASYEAIKKENPDALVYGIASAGVDTDMLKGVLEAGGYDYMDGVTIHPYDWQGSFRHGVHIKSVQEVHDLLIKYGGDKPVVYSEMGWTSADCVTGVGRKNQAIYAAQVVFLAKAHKLADAVDWYDFQDDGADETAQEYKFGLTEYAGGDYPLAAKESLLALAAANSFMAGKTDHITSIEKDDLETAVHFFDKGNGNKFGVIWTTKPEGDSIALDLGCGSIEVFDYYGNKLDTIVSNTGVFNFALADEPVYIKGSFERYDEAEITITQSASVITTVQNDEFEIVLNDAQKGNYEVYIETDPEHFTVLENDGMKDGLARIRLSVSDKAYGYYPTTIRLKNESGTVYVTSCAIDVGSPISVSVATRQFDDKNPNRWQIELDILNLTNSIPLSGVCKITEPEDVAEYVKEVKFSNVHPKYTRKIYLNLPEMIKKRTKDISGEIVLDYGFKTEFSQRVDFTAASYAENKPVIDGVLSDGEWIGNWMAADESENVFFTNTAYKNQWQDKENLSITGSKMMWDEENFYISVIVRDNIHVQDNIAKNLWMGDSIQFGIEDKNKSVVAATNTMFTEIGMALLPEGAKVYRYSSLYNKPVGVVDNCEVAITRTDNDTVYEAKIPWDELFYDDYDMNTSKVLGFAMLANDNDSDYRYGLIEYNSGIGKFKDALQFGRMKLLK